MPQVPKYGQPKVDATPLPGVRRSVDVPRAAFQPPASIDLSGVHGVLKEVVEQERQKADQIALTDAESKLAEVETELLYNPQTGLLNKKGLDAFGTPDEFEENWTKRASEIGKSLGNDRQKAAFDMAQKRRR